MQRLVVVGVAILALGGSWGAGGASGAGDESVLAYSAAAYAALDPAAVRCDNDERLVLALFDTLTAVDPTTGRVVPAAAERYEEAPDGRSWTFHLRSDGRWSDGSPVTAADFVAAWRRLVDPYESSAWAPLFRPLRGCAGIQDGDRAMRALSAASKGLKALLAANPRGVPGPELRALVERTGVRAAADDLDAAAVKKMLRWGEDPFSPEMAQEAADALKRARRAIKKEVYDAFDRFGQDVGPIAKDDRTLVVLLEGAYPALPDLVARAAFAPLHRSAASGSRSAFEVGNLVVNGAYALKGRGAKPRAGVPNPDSVVHLVRRDEYRGPRKGRMEEILCTTGQGAPEDLRRLGLGDIGWVADVPRSAAKEAESLTGFTRRPTGTVVLLRFRADRPPFDREDVRRAFALVLDRKGLSSSLWPAAAPAERLVPPGAIQGGVLRAPSGTAKEAKALLKAAGTSGDDFPWVEMHYAERNLDPHDDLAEAVVGQWQKALGVELGVRFDAAGDADAVIAAGAYQVALGVLRSEVPDPGGWVLPFAAEHPWSGLGWEDATFDALLAGARNVGALLAGGPEVLEGLPDDAKAAVESARRAGAATATAPRAALRLALLKAAEARLLDACVVVPLLFTEDAEIVRGVKDLGSAAAWRRPGFAGDLRHARR